MFLRQRPSPIYPDLSNDLADSLEWKVGQLKRLEFPQNITTFAIDPVSGLLAVGTSDGIIHLFGGSGVECKLTLPDKVTVSLLQFAISTFNLLCVDQQNQLHIWDLTSFGQPTYVANARFNQINSMCLSPSLSHVFFALHSGDIKTYDLACLRKSPYSIPNMWKLYEGKKMTQDMLSQNMLEHSLVDIVFHPRNLNAMFVAYGGGIVLTDISQRSARRIYELILPPGAPGGHEHQTYDILTQRHPVVTAISVHPSGHIFAVGYDDGSIAFWATEDDDRPILVRTLSKLDVNLVDPAILEAHLEGKENSSQSRVIREPIFKLTWSGFPNSEDPRGGSTVLTILGGIVIGQEAGVSVMTFPPLNPPDPPASESTLSTLHPTVRTAIRDSLSPSGLFFYTALHPVQDYLLIPRSSPHFSGSFDPYAIILLTEGTERNRVAEGYIFPSSLASTSGEVDVDEAESLADMCLCNFKVISPTKLMLPFALSIGCSGILGGMLVSLDREVYEIFIAVPPRNHNADIVLTGGTAWLDGTKANEMRLSKASAYLSPIMVCRQYQPPRVLITYHQDLSIRFHDMSSQLLMSQKTEPIQHHFPDSIQELVIDLQPLLARKNSNVSITGFEFAEESFEIAVALSSGEIVFYRPITSFTSSRSDVLDKEISLVLEENIISDKTTAPYFAFNAERGHPVTIAMSSIGFVAVSYEDGALYIIDMRGPRVLLRPAESQKKHKKTPSVTFGTRHHDSGQHDLATALSWVICPLAEEHSLKVRLVAAKASGIIEIYNLLHRNDINTWEISGEPLESKGIADPLHHGCYVIDAKTGASCNANKAKFAVSLRKDELQATDCILVLIGLKGARTYANINGERVGKAEWGHKFGITKGSRIIERLGHHALFVFNEQLAASVYSLPHLEYLHTVQLSLPPSIELTVDSTGDFIAFLPSETNPTINSAIYGTVFNARRIFTRVDLDLASSRTVIPPQPEPVSLGPTSMLGTWFNMKKTMSGEQMDELFGGPDRPIIKKQPSTSKYGADNSTEGSSSTANMAANIAAAASSAQSNLYNRLTSALGERGQLLGDLEDRFNSLEEGSKSMVAQAKKLAAQQTAKGWFGM
ncbi:WD40 containing snare-dependent exocytosis protein [Cyathus striatus]|nr:WD40 containing snare-dependent exocytosis protein [Cyathus striatus]